MHDKSVSTWLDMAMDSFKIPSRQCLKELRNTKWSFYVQANRSFCVLDSNPGNRLATTPHLFTVCCKTVVPKHRWVSSVWGCYWALRNPKNIRVFSVIPWLRLETIQCDAHVSSVLSNQYADNNIQRAYRSVSNNTCFYSTACFGLV